LEFFKHVRFRKRNETHPKKKYQRIFPECPLKFVVNGNVDTLITFLEETRALGCADKLEFPMISNLGYPLGPFS